MAEDNVVDLPVLRSCLLCVHVLVGGAGTYCAVYREFVDDEETWAFTCERYER